MRAHLSISVFAAFALPSIAMAQPEAAPSALTVVEETRTAEVQATPEAEPLEPPTQVDPGTHFILELNMGSSFAGSVGFAGSLLVGAGGKLKGFPPIFYLVAEGGYERGGSDGRLVGGSFQDGRDYADLSLGLRTYVPVFQDVRIFLDLLPGATYATSTLAREGFTDLYTSGWYAHFVLGVGVQVRVFRELSAGVRAKVLFTDDGLDDLREELGIHTPVPMVLSGSITWHL
jgi:hypothetical protein